jgi:hypothetical protein
VQHRLQPVTRVCTFWDCIVPEPYQGTTSVVPTITAGIKGFSPCAAQACDQRSYISLQLRLGKMVAQALACE